MGTDAIGDWPQAVLAATNYVELMTIHGEDIRVRLRAADQDEKQHSDQ